MAKASISRAWDESRAVLTGNGKILSAIALALLVLPGLIADLFMPAVPQGEMPKAGAWMVPLAISFLIALAGQLAIIRIAVGAQTTVGGAISHAFARAPIYIAATILWMLPFLLLLGFISSAAVEGGEQPSAGAAGIILLLSLIVLIGGVFLFIRMLMCGPVASNEPVGPIAVLRRSWQLTRGNWFRLFGFFLLFTIAAIVILMFVAIVAGLLGRLLSGEAGPMTVGGLLASLMAQLAGALVSVVFSVMVARIYVQLAGAGEPQASVPLSRD